MSQDQPTPTSADHPAPLEFAATIPRELGPATHANAQLLAEAFLMLSRAGALTERRKTVA